MFLRPTSLAEAIRALTETGAVPVAGGTDVFPAHVDRPPPARLLDLSRVPELCGIASDAGGIRIGAATTWAAILSADLPPAFDGLKVAAREVGSVQIQNRGTIGGNLCNASPAADGVPPLLTLDASVELAGPAGLRRMALPDFLLGNRRTARAADEILTAVILPHPAPGARGAFAKLGARRYLVISIVMAAATIARNPDGRIGTARVAVGAASAVAVRLPALEAALRALPPGIAPLGALRPEHLAPLAPIDDVRATASYRTDAALDLVGRVIEEAGRA